MEVRTKAIGIIRDKDRIFVGFGHDPKTKEEFYIPIGGGVEFNEKSYETVTREFKEETGLDVSDPKLLGILENIFEFNGKPGHEIIFVYEVKFKDKSVYKKDKITRVDDYGNNKVALWKPIEFFENPKNKLYPKGLFDLLK